MFDILNVVLDLRRAHVGEQATDLRTIRFRKAHDVQGIERFLTRDICRSEWNFSVRIPVT